MLTFNEFKQGCINLVRGELGMENSSSNTESPLGKYYYYSVEEKPLSITIGFHWDNESFLVSLYTSEGVLGIATGDSLKAAYENALERAKAA